MTSPGARPRKSGFLAKMQAASVPVIPEDDGKLIIRPRGVTIASVLVIIAGAIIVFSGIAGYVQTDAYLADSVQLNTTLLADCTKSFGGFGTTLAAATVPSLTSSAALCHSAVKPTAAVIDGFRTASHVVGIVFALIGLMFIAAGWFLRAGARWAKRTVVTGSAVLLLAAAVLRLSTPYTLLATLLLVVAVVMTYLGQNSIYFARVARRGKLH